MIEDPCATCSGSGQVQKARRLRVNIPAGVRDGSRVRIAGKGEPGATAAPTATSTSSRASTPRPSSSAAATTSRSRCRSRFPRRCAAPTSRCRRSAGARRCASRPGTAHGTLQRLRGEGPPRLGGKGNGDIHYRFLIDVPETLDAEQSELVDKLSATMNGTDPRAELFQAGPQPS